MLYLIALYCTLGSHDYDRREAASDRLAELVTGKPWQYGPRLRDLARGATDPEIAHRVQMPLAAYERWQIASYVPSTCPVWPCCDMLAVPMMLGDCRCRALGFEWINQVPYDFHSAADGCALVNGPYYHRWRRGTELMVQQMLRDGATHEECDRLLSRMWAIENAFNGDSGEKWEESKAWKHWQGGYPQPRTEP